MKLYQYDKSELRFKEVSLKYYVIRFLAILFVFSGLSFGVATKVIYETILMVYVAEKEQFNIENFKKEVFNSKIRFPNVVS